MDQKIHNYSTNAEELEYRGMPRCADATTSKSNPRLKQHILLDDGSETQPLVSIIISCYNSEKFLPDALMAIVEQTYQNLEIVLINNGSSGNVKEIYDDFSTLYTSLKWKYVEFADNIGLFRAYCAGFENADGDFIGTIDCDDTISIDFVYQMITSAISKKADVVSAICIDHYIN